MIQIFLFGFDKKNMLCYLIVYNLVLRIEHVNKCKALKIMPDTQKML